MYFMATRAWRWGKKYDLRSQPDLLGKRFDSPAVQDHRQRHRHRVPVPWVVLGMQALGTVFELASDGAWSVTHMPARRARRRSSSGSTGPSGWGCAV